MRFAPLALLLALCGCSSAHSYRIDAGGEGAAVIREAMAKWNAALLPEDRLVEVRSGATWRVAYFPHSVMGRAGDDGLTCEKGDQPCPDDSTIMLDEEILDYEDRGVAREVVMHELGHSIGLDHIASPGVMNPSPDQLSDVLTPGDLRECRDHGECP